MRRVTPSMLTLLITLIFIALIGSGFSINPTNSFSFFTDLHGLIQPTLDLSTLNRNVTVDEPVIATDKVRYLAGENVGIGGSGFAPGTRIKIQIVPTDVVLGTNENPEEIVVIVDDNGQFEASWPLESDTSGFLFSAQAEQAAPVYFGRVADLYTDKYDYNTGDTALITGDGFNPNEQVTLQVLHSNGQNGGGGHLPFTTNADADGRISTTWYVNPDDSHDEIFRIRAYGNESGIETYSTITDPPIIVVDDGGPDDNPGQKDLTFIQVDDPMLGIQSVVWGWDDTRWTGNNTGDACVLYDNDGDGFANFALCVTISQTITSPPPTFQLYSCGNTRTDRCAQPATPIATQNSTGSASIGLDVDPFRTNPVHTTGNTCDQRPACYDDDTLANVSVHLADVAGPGATRLTNVCSYPSGQPNSDPSDCILNPNNGRLTIVKVATPNDPVNFVFNASAPSQGNVSQWTIPGSGSVEQISYPAGNTLDLNEVVPSGWSLTGASCIINNGTTNPPTGTPTATGVNDITIQASIETVCTFNNQLATGTVTLIKQVAGGTPQATFGFATTGLGVGASSTITTNGANNQIVFSNVASGSKTINENALPTGWTFSTVQCVGASGTPTYVGPLATFDLAGGGSVTCTYLNVYAPPQLTLTKNVTNDNGGSAHASAWTLAATGSSGSFSGTGAPATGPTASLTNPVVAGVQYTLSESGGPAGYSSTGIWSCTGGGVFVAPNLITLADGESANCSIVNDDQAANLIIIKSVVNDNGGNAVAGDFGGNITGTATFSGGNTWTGTVAPGQNKLATALGSYNVVENAFPGYAVTYSADCNSTIALGQTKTCTVTNNDIAPTLTLTKVVTNNNGGTAGPNDFGISVGGNVVVSGASNAYNANTPLAINEAGLAGYSFVSITGDAKCPAVLGGTVTLDEGENVSCTITNDDQPANLIIIKSVVNDNGGNAVAGDFGGNITGTATFSGGNTWTGTVAPGQNKLATALGSYNVVENAFPGYAVTYSADCNSTIALGQTKTCTVTNNDIAPTLTLTKVVTNNNGGTAGPNDFGISVGGNVVVSGASNAYNANTPLAINEAGLAGYSFVSITGDAKCPAVLGGTVTLDEGENVSCTITNDDQPANLIIIKSVVNDNGGNAVAGDFGGNITGTATFSGGNTWTGTVAPGQNKLATALGSYNVVENAFPGYAVTYSADCNSTIALGQTKTCTVTNNDIAPTLTLTKVVTNNNGGTAGPNDFGISVGGNVVVSGASNAYNANTPLAINEAGLAGYSFVSITGNAKCPAVLGGTVTLDEGENVSCTITNDDQPANLIIIKSVVNDNGGNAVAGDFGGNITGTATFSGGNTWTGTVAPGQNKLATALGSYNVVENAFPGYAVTYSADCNSTIALGQTKTCTVTNNDIAPTLTLTKVVTNNNGGTAGPNDFGISVGGNVVVSGASNAYNANTPLAINEAGLAGYSFVSITGDAKCPAVLGGTVTLDEGENVSCTITNDDQQAFITVVKSVVNDSGGTAQPNDFLLTLEGVPVSSGVQVPVNPGTYTAAETLLTGYTFEGFTGQCDSNGDVTVALGESKTCTLTNNDQQAHITVVKVVTNDNGGSAQPNDFLLTLEGSPVLSGVQVPVNPGTYTAGETPLSGYTFEGFTGQCDSNGDVTVALGESKTCTLTNNDQQAYITVIKTVINDNGGTAQPNDFNLTLEGSPVSSGVQVPVNPGTYTAGETPLSGYTFVGFTGQCDSNGDVTVALGQSKTCTLTNNDQPGTLIVRKIVLSPNADDTPDDFSYTINGGPSIPFEADGENSHVVNMGSYTVVENPANGFVTTYDNCTNVLIPLGGQQICTITNIFVTGFVTSSSLCTFDVAPDKDGSQFRLLFTPDGSVSVNKLNASNPGQYFYNVLHFNPPGPGPEDTVTMNIPFPFVTQGATPVHLYSSVTTKVNEGQVCLMPGTNVGNQQDLIALADYLVVNPTPVLGVTSKSVTVQVPDGFTYVNIHLDYGLKRTSGYVKSVVGGMNNADQQNNAPLLPDIPDMQDYTFSNGGVHVVQSINNFKKNPGVGGLFRTDEEIAVPDQTVELYNQYGVLVGSRAVSDEDGWYFISYKHTGREAQFTVLWTQTGLTKQVRLKANGMAQADFP